MKSKFSMFCVIVFFGVIGTAFAIHDPNQPQNHSIILPLDAKEKTFDEFMEWCKPHYEEKRCEELYKKNLTADLLPPLKQIKSGVSLIDVKCNEGKVKVIKYDRMMAACVNSNTESQAKLIDRGWALLRFIMPGENTAHALCNNYEGKWHPEHEGCRGEHLTDLQCSLMGGEFVDNLKICYNDICPENKTYTLCITDLTFQKESK